MKRCKTCLSDYTLEVRTWALQGYSNHDIEKRLNDMGIQISHASVGRHLKNCEGINKDNRLDIVKSTSEKEAVTPTPFLIEPDSIDFKSLDSFELMGLIKKDFLQLVLNQLSICTGMQKGFMNGECRHPGNEIKSLKNIFEVINMMTNSKSENPLFDFDELFQLTRYLKKYNSKDDFEKDDSAEKYIEAIDSDILASGKRKHIEAITLDDRLEYLAQREKMIDLLGEGHE